MCAAYNPVSQTYTGTLNTSPAFTTIPYPTTTGNEHTLTQTQPHSSTVQGTNYLVPRIFERDNNNSKPSQSLRRAIADLEPIHDFMSFTNHNVTHAPVGKPARIGPLPRLIDHLHRTIPQSDQGQNSLESPFPQPLIRDIHMKQDPAHNGLYVQLPKTNGAPPTNTIKRRGGPDHWASIFDLCGVRGR